MLNKFDVTAVVDGEGAGDLLSIDAPISFWGGVDPTNGKIVEPSHPQISQSVAKRVLLMERAKGSSSSSSVLAELIRHRIGPSAIVMREMDLIVGLGCIVASELCQIHVPIVIADTETWCILVARSGTRCVITASSADGIGNAFLS